MGYNVIQKGKFAQSLIGDFVSLTHFLVIKEEGRKYLLLKLLNGRDEKVTGVRLEVVQKDVRGQTLRILTEECNDLNAGPAAPFVLDRRIALADNCTNFTVKILSADCGNYRYWAQDCQTVLSYVSDSERAAAKNAGSALSRKAAGKTGAENSVSIRRFKAPAAVCFVILAMLVISAFCTYGQLQNFMAKTDTFFYAGVEYAFEGGDKSLDSPIYVVGSKSMARNIVIEEKIKGHEVTGISPYAFSGNLMIEKVTVKGALEIKSSTFSNCGRLSSVSMEKVTRIGDYAFNNCGALREFRAFNLDKIGQSAFAGCTGLETLTIANNASVLKIGANAFQSCSKLEKIDIDQFIAYSENPDFLWGCTGVKSLRLKNYNYAYEFGGEYFENYDKTITSLFRYTDMAAALRELVIDYCDTIPDSFCHNFGVASVIIKNGAVSEVGANAFNNCVNLKNLELPRPLTAVGQSAFYKTAITDFDGSGLMSIGQDAFSQCARLSEFRLEGNDGLNNIGSGAFKGCVMLESIYVSEAVTKIDSSTFEDCYNLSQVTFGGERITISSYAFSSCFSLREAPLLEQAVSVGAYAFAGCESLESVNFSQNLTVIDGYAFAGCNRIKSISVPSSAGKIGKGAFSNCSALEEMTLPFIGGAPSQDRYFSYIFGSERFSSDNVPESLKKVSVPSARDIDDNAFYGCSDLKEIVIGNVTNIGEEAFSGCRSLNNFIIPASVESIGAGAFKGCYRLYEICNLSGLDIKHLSVAHGMAGYYALKIYSYSAEPKITKTSYSGFDFARTDEGKWYVTDYTDSSVSVSFPRNVYYGGVSIGTYEVVKYLFTDDNVVQYVYIPDTVTAIGEYSFADCPALVSAIVGDGVTAIGIGAFAGCWSLTDITLPFAGGSQYDDARDYMPGDWPDVETKPGDDLLFNNRYLGYIFGAVNAYVWTDAIPYSLKMVALTKAEGIPAYGFRSCYGLETVILPETVRAIGYSAFYNCYNLKTIALPGGLEKIGKEAFGSCSQIKEITLPSSVQTVEQWAFADCRGLEKVILWSFADIRTEAFLGCFYLYEVYNLGGLAITAGSAGSGYIAYYAIAVHTSLKDAALKTATLSNGLVFKYLNDIWSLVDYTGNETNLRLSSFIYNTTIISSYNIRNNAFANKGYPVNLSVAKEVEAIGGSAFENCYNLKTVKFEEDSGITKLAEYVFSSCTALVAVNLPPELIRIERYAFSNCRQMFLIAIPKKVVEIGESAFWNCSALCDVYNFSQLPIKKGEEGNGYAGYYALRVSTSAVAPLETAEHGDFRFMLFGGEWYLISFVMSGSSLSLPSWFEYNGTTFFSYTLLESALAQRYYNDIFIPLSVIKIQRNHNCWYYLNAIFYQGNVSQWAALTESIPGSQLCSAVVYYNC